MKNKTGTYKTLEILESLDIVKISKQELKI